jgi:hypothetical protein
MAKTTLDVFLTLKSAIVMARDPLVINEVYD